MANSRDFTGKNRKFTGTKGIVVSKGTTGQRVGAEAGELRFNTTTELMEYFDGTAFKPIDSPPTISSVSTSDTVGTNTVLNADGSSLFTITITGGNFSFGPTVKFIGSTGTEYTPGNINRVSASSITCTTLSSMGTTDDPYDVQVTNTSNLSATLDDAFSFNAAPVFVNASGQLGTVFNGQAITGTTLNAGATDAEGNTITFSIISGALPGTGLTLSSSTGAITGTLASTPSLGNYSFIVQAATTEGTITRQFSIQVITNPFVAATGGTVTTSGDYKIHTFTGPGTFTVTNAGNPTGSDTVDYLVVAGGGSGGMGNIGGSAGGGAGGLRISSGTASGSYTVSPLGSGVSALPVSAQGYPITVGSGGAAVTGAGVAGNTGNSSTFSSVTSAGGGKGSGHDAVGSSGGSGSGGNGAGPKAPEVGYAGNTPPTSPSQGNPGGQGANTAPNYGSGGGGGAGATGSSVSPPSNPGGPGGNGIQTNINGTLHYFAGGGGGSSYTQPGSIGGNGGLGGGGGGHSAADSSGTGGPGLNNGAAGGPAPGGIGGAGGTNTGGGGGGGTHFPGSSGAGGSGIVIIRYQFQ